MGHLLVDVHDESHTHHALDSHQAEWEEFEHHLGLRVSGKQGMERRMKR